VVASPEEQARKMKSFRQTHCKNHRQIMISFHVRPATKDGLQTFIKTDAFLSSRGDSEHPGPCLFWYDASADLDVKVGTHKAANPFRTVVVPDISWFRVFFRGGLQHV